MGRDPTKRVPGLLITVQLAQTLKSDVHYPNHPYQKIVQNDCFLRAEQEVCLCLEVAVQVRGRYYLIRCGLQIMKPKLRHTNDLQAHYISSPHVFLR